EVAKKPDDTPVTPADREAEQAIVEILGRAFPDCGVLGEEFGGRGTKEVRWIIDPIDGTKNFVRGIGIWATLIALEERGEVTVGVIHNPVTAELYTARRGAGAFLNGERIRASDVAELGRAFFLLAVPALRSLRHRYPREPLVLAAQPRIGGLLAALGVVDRALSFDALDLDGLFGPERRDPAPLLREATRVVSWFGARDPDFVRRLGALVPDAVVAPSVGGGRPVWEHLLASVGALADDTRRWCEPVAPPDALVEEGRRLLVAAGWDGRGR